jgi:hypothetical protein
MSEAEVEVVRRAAATYTERGAEAVLELATKQEALAAAGVAAG